MTRIEHPGEPGVHLTRVKGAAGLLLPATLLFLAAACGGDATGPDDAVSTAVDLEVGESQVLRDDGNVIRFHLPGADEGREYRLAVQSGSQATGRTPMRLRLSGSGASGEVAPAGARSGFPTPLGDWRLTELEPRVQHDLAELELKQNVRRELERVGARPVRPELPALLDETVNQGDTLEILFGVFEDEDGRLSVACAEEDIAKVDTITAVVQAVGGQAAMVEDTMVDATASAQMDYEGLAEEFDEVVFDTNVAYFGEPTDIDGNGVVLVVFTPEVNELGESNDDTFVAGFFLASDLADRTQCVSSNEGELVYLLAPEAVGNFDAEFAERSARGTSAHEFQHLINAGNRLIDQDGSFADLEDTWLDEALSHLAEEVVGLRKTGLAVRDNLTFQDVTSTQEDVDAFNAFHIQNFFRLQRFFQAPDTTRALSEDDPGGVASLRMRGFAWNFGRWLGDHEGPPGSGVVEGSLEEELFRELARGSGQLLSGVENVERAIQNVTGRSVQWRDLLADFAPMPAVTDDAPSEDLHQLLTWDLRDVFRGLHENLPGSFPEEYPLAVTVTGFSSGAFDFEVEGSAKRHFTLESSGSTSEVTVELTNQADGPLPAGSAPQITIVRVR